MITNIVVALAVSLIFNLLMFLLAYRFQSDKLTDISYALSFFALAILCIVHSTANHRLYILLGSLAVILWAVRIGSYLLYRVMKVGKDSRFDDIRNHFLKFANFWLGQAFAAWVLMLPLIMSEKSTKGISTIGVIALVIFIIAFLIEAAADQQKSIFKANTSNKGKWIDKGLWKYSRHPNYLGEILVWVAIYIYSFNHLSSSGKLIGLASPLFIFILLRFVSGVPILEKSAEKKWGNDPSYKQYKSRSGLILPRIL